MTNADSTTKKTNAELVLSRMKYYKQHPKHSQRFMDIFPIFTSPSATEAVISDLTTHISNTYNVEQEVIAIVGPEAEGFVLGPLIAGRLGIPFIPARKKGKLPGEVLRQRYSKWSGEDVFEMQKGAFGGLDMEGKGVVLVDDSVASGGSAGAVKNLIERLGVPVLCGCFIFEADMPNHRETQRDNFGNLDIYAMLKISEKTLEGMELFDGRKNEEGEYVGDAGEGESPTKPFSSY